MSQTGASSLKILHVLRAPLGGLFRHVVDVARAQAARGHKVGLVADSLTGGDGADAILGELSPHLALGVSRTAIPRHFSARDAYALAHVVQRIRQTQPDIVHGHGSKGGAFARIPALLSLTPAVKTAYTPHGGSLNYRPGSLAHTFYMAVERMLVGGTHAFLFESAFIQSRFHAYVRDRVPLERVVLNGIGRDEFQPVSPAVDAADFLYIGELRSAKGIDTMIDALAQTGRETGRMPRAVFVGSGPERDDLQRRAHALGLEPYVQFPGPMRARDAFRLGRIMVAPSRAESLPYVILEAAGARRPLIATNVGGIPEIFGPYADRLIPCDDVGRLARAMKDALTTPDETHQAFADDLFRYVESRFTIDAMVDAVMAAYAAALAAPATTAAPAKGAAIPS